MAEYVTSATMAEYVTSATVWAANMGQQKTVVYYCFPSIWRHLGVIWLHLAQDGSMAQDSSEMSSRWHRISLRLGRKVSRFQYSPRQYSIFELARLLGIPCKFWNFTNFVFFDFFYDFWTVWLTISKFQKNRIPFFVKKLKCVRPKINVFADFCCKKSKFAGKSKISQNVPKHIFLIPQPKKMGGNILSGRTERFRKISEISNGL